MPLTSITQDAEQLSLTVVGDYAVPRSRLWEAFADPRQLERFWGPPAWPATFTHHDMTVGGRAEYTLTGPEGQTWSGSWTFTDIDPVSSFRAVDGDGAVDEDGPSGMTFTFDTTETGSRMTIVSWFADLKAMEHNAAGMEEGLRAAVPQLDTVLAGGTEA